MKFSLLYKTPEQPDYDSLTDMREAAYNLSVDRLVNAFCPDETRAETFLKVLMRPLHHEENIYYRQELVENFSKQPQLLFALRADHEIELAEVAAAERSHDARHV